MAVEAPDSRNRGQGRGRWAGGTRGPSGTRVERKLGGGRQGTEFSVFRRFADDFRLLPRAASGGRGLGSVCDLAQIVFVAQVHHGTPSEIKPHAQAERAQAPAVSNYFWPA